MLELFHEMREEGAGPSDTLESCTCISSGFLCHSAPNAPTNARTQVPHRTMTYNSVLEACVNCGDIVSAEALVLHEPLGRPVSPPSNSSTDPKLAVLTPGSPARENIFDQMQTEIEIMPDLISILAHVWEATLTQP